MQLITQQAWRTANTVSHAARRSGPAPGVELHHTATARAASGDRLVAIARAIYGDHVGARGWADVFYGFLIGDTHVLEARGWDRLSGELPFVVIALVGDYRTGQDRLTDFQRDAVLWARAELIGRGGGTALTWHSRRASTDCPGGHVIEFAEHLIRTPIIDLIAQLDGEQFWQIHRSTVINVEHLAGTRRDEASRLFVRMKGLARELPVSRAYVPLFKAM